MKKKSLFTLLFISALSVSTLYAQESAIPPINNGDSLLTAGDVKGAIAAYKRVYFEEKPEHFGAYNVAAAYSVDRQLDSAFRYLFLSLQTDTTIRACADPYFLPLRNDQRWNAFRDSAIGAVLALKPGVVKNVALAKLLWDLSAWDQAYYYEIDIAEKKFGANTPVVNALWDVKAKINRRNAHILDSVVGIHGWPSIPMVGYYASEGAFLVVQHSDLERQQKYLPMIKVLCDSGHVLWENYALMYDRIQVSQEKPQLYGTQVKLNDETGKHEFFPIEDEKNVNKRREEMGMWPIEEYAKFFDIEYQPK